MNAAAPALAGALSLACAAAPAAATTPAPTRAQVEDALEDDLNTLCGGALESENCVSHPSSVKVRRLRCTPEKEDAALCQYERRIDTIGRAPRWRPAVSRFRSDPRGSWKTGFDFALKPEPTDVEGALTFEAGRPCRDLIDACIDGDGNSLFREPQFRVSGLRCSPLEAQRSLCSFKAIEFYEGESDGPKRTCRAILATYEDGYGNQGWTIFYDLRRHASTLTCN